MMILTIIPTPWRAEFPITTYRVTTRISCARVRSTLTAAWRTLTLRMQWRKLFPATRKIFLARRSNAISTEKIRWKLTKMTSCTSKTRKRRNAEIVKIPNISLSFRWTI
jgi:hypothetical protein